MDLLFLKPRKSDEAGPWEHCPGAHTRTAFAGFCVDCVYTIIIVIQIVLIVTSQLLKFIR